MGAKCESNGTTEKLQNAALLQTRSVHLFAHVNVIVRERVIHCLKFNTPFFTHRSLHNLFVWMHLGSHTGIKVR
jgi:hypothetical protein